MTMKKKKKEGGGNKKREMGHEDYPELEISAVYLNAAPIQYSINRNVSSSLYSLQRRERKKRKKEKREKYS